MKRFYKQVTVDHENGGYFVLLDGKKVKTPEKSPCLIPTRKMAEAVAREWDDQDKEIIPATMPIFKLVNTAIDRVKKRRDEVIYEMVSFAGSDQLCYRAEAPDTLVRLQNSTWNPLLDWLKVNFDIKLKLSTGIIFVEQDSEQLDKFRTIFENLESFELTALYTMITVTGSVTVGLSLFKEHLSLEQAWEAGHLDENFQASEWGIDEEAEQRRSALKTELANAEYFLKLIRET
ncbi:MAG: ATPase [Alphaproteobacteria bacterium]|nr:ATPase [Alphaproteobacteria bacterium]HPF45767.1 ATP12 family protein [Emcibacteraceae bacterium]HRW28674.1 ATP12 family protein [Emcibacteraceae bacterium]